jgi:hypothetical protein
MFDANECREHAKRCVIMATQATDPVIRERLSETAQAWARLASQLADIHEPPATWRDTDKQVA